MNLLDQITSLNKTDLVMSGALVLALITASVIPVDDGANKSGVYVVPTIAAVKPAPQPSPEILPGSEVDTRSYPSTLPDFSAITDVRTKKQKFFNYMLPKIRQANDKVRANRRLLLMIRDDIRTGETLDEDDLQFLSELTRRYRIGQHSSLSATVDDLLIRVDVVPESLVLAQAANESGWGTSRFATQANNLFGVWCFREGCGLTPLKRDEGLTHEVAKYDSVQQSIAAYIHTINTNAAYVVLRDIRVNTRSEEEQHFNGLALAEGLLKYSSRGIDYVREIQQLIRVNNLQKYTLPLQV